MITFENVRKKFRLHKEKGSTLKGALLNFFKRKPFYEEFMALDDVSFAINASETIGIIGENGSGKSTILKLISGILVPDRGRIQVDGRVSSLLELGAGFHPELTGRENVFLNGTILGIPHKETVRLFDKILAFSGIEQFIDVPVKFYSSGMYMRLAFSVAVNVDPDILLVDEVLAVGDEEFQRKCFEKIYEFKAKGKTIVFVSHDLSAVKKTCSKTLWIDKGKMQGFDATEKIVAEYKQSIFEKRDDFLKNMLAGERWGTQDIMFTEIKMFGKAGKAKKVFNPSEHIRIELSYKVNEKVDACVFGIAIYRRDGLNIGGTNTFLCDAKLGDCGKSGKVILEMKNLPLLNGDYFLTAAVQNITGDCVYDWFERACVFSMQNVSNTVFPGILFLETKWSMKAQVN